MDLQKATVIDVRTPQEFAMGNVKGSINIPLDTLPFKLDEVENLQMPLIICCASGGRSYNACNFLYGKGITEIVDGGAWQNVANQLQAAG